MIFIWYYKCSLLCFFVYPDTLCQNPAWDPTLRHVCGISGQHCGEGSLEQRGQFGKFLQESGRQVAAWKRRYCLLNSSSVSVSFCVPSHFDPHNSLERCKLSRVTDEEMRPRVQGLTPHHLAYGHVFSACFQLPSLPLCCMGRSWINGKEADIEKTLPRPSPWCF